MRQRPDADRRPEDADGMHALDPALWERLQTARPDDAQVVPRDDDYERAEARVLARVRVLGVGQVEGQARAARRRVRMRMVVGGLAASLLLGLLVGRSLDDDAPSSGRTPPIVGGTTEARVPPGPNLPRGADLPHEPGRGGVSTTAAVGVSERSEEPEPLPAFVAGAVRGEPSAVLALRRADRPLRRRLLTEIGEGHADGPELLALLASFGGPRGFEETRRLAELVVQPRLAREAIRWLSADTGTLGLRALGTRLVEDPTHEPEIVAGLERMARRGRLRAALAALEEGLALGRVDAARAFLELGGAPALARLLKRAPDRVLRDRGIGDVVRAANRTTHALLARHVERGDAAALTLAHTARLDMAVPRLTRHAVGSEPASARRAVAALVEIGSLRSDLALAAALDGAAAEAAQAPLRALPEERRDALAERVRRSVRDAPLALRALSAAGPGGLDHLDRLARHPGLAPQVIAVLADAPDPGATERIVALMRRRALLEPGARALAQRLAAGDRAAGESLLEVARGGRDRLVFRLLAPLGMRAVPLLERMGETPHLATRARRLLDRIDRPTASSNRPTRGRRTPAP